MIHIIDIGSMALARHTRTHTHVIKRQPTSSSSSSSSSPLPPPSHHHRHHRHRVIRHSKLANATFDINLHQITRAVLCVKLKARNVEKVSMLSEI